MVSPHTESLADSPEITPGLVDLSQAIGQVALGHSALYDSGDDPEADHHIEKRDYQLEVWEAIDQARSNGDKSALIHLAMGLGKTTIAVVDALRFMDEFIAEHGRAPRILFASHKNEINEQAAERFQEFAPDLKQHEYSSNDYDPEAHVTFSTVQMLHRNLDSLASDSFDYIIYDEAHHMQAETFKPVVNHFEPEFQLALTGTPDRMDEEDIRELFGVEKYKKPLAAAMAEGYLADVDYHIVFDKAVKQAMEQGFDSITLKEIKELLSNESRNEEIALQIMEEMESIGLQGAKTILFCHNIAQATEMAELLGGAAYHSGVSKEERKNILKRFKEGDLSVICTRDMFNEGIDIPDARLIVFMRSTGSQTVFEQQLGRGLRKYAGKHRVSVLDFVANIERLEHVKALADELAEHQQGSSGHERGGGLHITTEHGEFDFDRLSVELIEKIKSLRRGEYRDWSHIETIEDAAELWVEMFGETRPTHDLVNKASIEGTFVSGSKVNSIGGLTALREKLGFDVIHYDQIETMADVAALWEERFPGVRPTKAGVKKASKAGEFVSTGIVGKHGGFKELLRNLDYFVIDYDKLDSIGDVAKLWNVHFEGVNPDRRSIAAASKAGLFISEPKLKEFGDFEDLRNALGQEKDPRKEVKSMEDAAELWRTLFPDVKPTGRLIEKASSEQRYVSQSLIKKLGGLPLLRKELGFETVKRIKASDIEDIKDLAELWDKQFPDTPPTKETVSQASKDTVFVSLGVLRKFGGLPALKEALGYEASPDYKKWQDLKTPEDLARLWRETYGDVKPTTGNHSKLVKNQEFPSIPTVGKRGGFKALRKAYDELDD